MNHSARSMCFVLAALSAACSGIAQRAKDRQSQEQYLHYAAAPVDHFTYLGPYDNWQSLSNTQLVVWTSLNDAYLLTVREPCINLQFTNRIGVSSTAGTVTNRLDSVLVEHDRCQITEIRPVDYRKMRAELRKDKQ